MNCALHIKCSKASKRFIMQDENLIFIACGKAFKLHDIFILLFQNIAIALGYNQESLNSIGSHSNNSLKCCILPVNISEKRHFTA